VWGYTGLTIFTGRFLGPFFSNEGGDNCWRGLRNVSILTPFFSYGRVLGVFGGFLPLFLLDLWPRNDQTGQSKLDLFWIQSDTFWMKTYRFGHFSNTFWFGPRFLTFLMKTQLFWWKTDTFDDSFSDCFWTLFLCHFSDLFFDFLGSLFWLFNRFSTFSIVNRVGGYGIVNLSFQLESDFLRFNWGKIGIERFFQSDWDLERFWRVLKLNWLGKNRDCGLGFSIDWTTGFENVLDCVIFVDFEIPGRNGRSVFDWVLGTFSLFEVYSSTFWGHFFTLFLIDFWLFWWILVFLDFEPVFWLFWSIFDFFWQISDFFDEFWLFWWILTFWRFWWFWHYWLARFDLFFLSDRRIILLTRSGTCDVSVRSKEIQQAHSSTKQNKERSG